MVHREQLVVQLRRGDLQREPALGHRRGKQRVGAVPGPRIPRGRVLAELPVLPDFHDPRRDQMLGLRQRQYRVTLRVGAAVGDIDAAVAHQHLQQQRLYRRKCPLNCLLVGRAHHPGRQDVRADHTLHLGEVMVFVDRPVVHRHGLGRKERQSGDLMAGEVGDHRRGDPRVGPLHVLAPVRAQRQRHHHIPQQHRHVHRGVGHQRQPEGDQRMSVKVDRQRQGRGHRLPEHMLTDHDAQRAGIQRHDLPWPVDHHMLAGQRQLRRRPQVLLPGAAGTEPLGPDPPQRPVGGNLHHAGAEPVQHVLADELLLGRHRRPRPVQAVGADREDGLPQLPGHQVVPVAAA